jgi:hypothetical protein
MSRTPVRPPDNREWPFFATYESMERSEIERLVKQHPIVAAYIGWDVRLEQDKARGG